jgi:hypothetical protein
VISHLIWLLINGSQKTIAWFRLSVILGYFSSECTEQNLILLRTLPPTPPPTVEHMENVYYYVHNLLKNNKADVKLRRRARKFEYQIVLGGAKRNEN